MTNMFLIPDSFRFSSGRSIKPPVRRSKRQGRESPVVPSEADKRHFNRLPSEIPNQRPTGNPEGPKPHRRHAKHQSDAAASHDALPLRSERLDSRRPRARENRYHPIGGRTRPAPTALEASFIEHRSLLRRPPVHPRLRRELLHNEVDRASADRPEFHLVHRVRNIGPRCYYDHRNGFGAVHALQAAADREQRRRRVAGFRTEQGVPDHPGAAFTSTEKCHCARDERDRTASQMDRKFAPLSINYA